MNDDDFATAARAEAERLTPEGTSVPVLRTERDNLVHMAEWARTYLAEQEATDAELHAAILAFDGLSEHYAPGDAMRAALTAARSVRRDAR